MKKFNFKISIAVILSILLIILVGWILIPQNQKLLSWNNSNLKIAENPRKKGLNITFIVVSDTHFGSKASTIYFNKEKNKHFRKWVEISDFSKQQIEDMNTITGKSYPDDIGGKVASPKGVIVTGDLTQDGKKNEWETFEKFYGLTGKDGLLKFPVYECLGNHDLRAGNFIRKKVAKRHGGNSIYVWNWDDLYLINLGEAPDNSDLKWLMKNLAQIGKEKPVILYFHFPLAGPYNKNWFTEGNYRTSLNNIIKDFNIIGIFHGHFHGSGFYKWNNIDVYNMGSVKHNWRDFAVVNVTDKKMSVAAWNSEQHHWWWYHIKPINGEDGIEKLVKLKPGPIIPYPANW
jgi:Calcineurin-like phosphoesterase